MKLNKKFAWCVPVALVCTLMLAGCDIGTSPGGPGIITWTLAQEGGVLGGNDVPTSDTNAIIIKFSGEVTDLADADITVSGSVATKNGALSQRQDNEWSVPVTVTASEAAMVTINKTGITGGSKTVMVYKTGQQLPIDWSATVNGRSNSTTSTQITFTFTEAVTGLTANDIILTNGTGSATKGALTGSGRSWILGITGVSQGNITVAINKTGVTATGKTVTVHQRPPSVSGPAKSITITGLGSYNGKGISVALSGNQDLFFELFFSEDDPDIPYEAGGYGSVQGSSATVDLYSDEDFIERWTGNGRWYVLLAIFDDDDFDDDGYYYGTPQGIYVSTNTVNFSAASIQSPFTSFKKLAFATTFGEFVSTYMGSTVTIPLQGITLDKFVEEASNGAALTWGDSVRALLYKDEAMTIPFVGTDTVYSNTRIYIDPLNFLGGGNKIGEISGTITLTDVPNPPPLVFIEGGVQVADPYGSYGVSLQPSRIKGITGSTASNLNWSIPVYFPPGRADDFIGSSCGFSLQVCPSARDPNTYAEFIIAEPYSSLYIANDANYNAGYLGSVSIATVTFSGTINFTHSGTRPPRHRLYIRVSDYPRGGGNVELSLPEPGTAWSMPFPASDFSTPATMTFNVSGYQGSGGGSIYEKTFTVTINSMGDMSNIVLDLEHLY